MDITDVIKGIEQYAQSELRQLPFPKNRIAGAEVAKRLLSGNLNGEPASDSSTISIRVSDEISEIMLALFSYNKMLPRDVIECVTLIMDYCAHMLGGLDDG